MAWDFLKWPLELSSNMASIVSEEAQWGQPSKAKLLVPKSWLFLFHTILFSAVLLQTVSSSFIGQRQSADQIQYSPRSHLSVNFILQEPGSCGMRLLCDSNQDTNMPNNQESRFKGLLLIKNKTRGRRFRVMEPYKNIVRTNHKERKMSGQVFLFWRVTKSKIDIENAIDRKGSKWYRLNTCLKIQVCWKHLNCSNLSKCLWKQALIHQLICGNTLARGKEFHIIFAKHSKWWESRIPTYALAVLSC